MESRIRMTNWWSGWTLLMAIMASGCGFGTDLSSPGVSEDFTTEDSPTAITGTLRIMLRDAPSDEVDQVWVAFDQVTVHHDQLGWLVVSNQYQEVDLLTLQDGVMEQLGLAILDVGRYSQIRLQLVDSWIVVDGVEEELTVPSGDQSGLKVDHEFEINPCITTTLELDWDVGAHLLWNQGQGYKLRPTIQVTSSEEPTPGCGCIPIIEEDWESGIGAGWIKYGSPAPFASPDAHASSYALDPNGDSWCQSGVVSSTTHYLLPGMSISAFIRSAAGGLFQNVYIGFSAVDPQGGTCADNYDWFVKFGIEPEYPGHEMRASVRCSDGSAEAYRPAFPDWSNWHDFTALINPDWTVTFFIDDAPVHTSTCSISQGLLVRTGIDGRSYNGSAVADDLLVCQ